MVTTETMASKLPFIHGSGHTMMSSGAGVSRAKSQRSLALAGMDAWMKWMNANKTSFV